MSLALLLSCFMAVPLMVAAMMGPNLPRRRRLAATHATGALEAWHRRYDDALADGKDPAQAVSLADAPVAEPSAFTNASRTHVPPSSDTWRLGHGGPVNSTTTMIRGGSLPELVASGIITPQLARECAGGDLTSRALAIDLRARELRAAGVARPHVVAEAELLRGEIISFRLF